MTIYLKIIKLFKTKAKSILIPLNDIDAFVLSFLLIIFI